LATQAKVHRDGVTLSISARDLVPGDLVEVSGGESFPAEVRDRSCCFQQSIVEQITAFSARGIVQVPALAALLQLSPLHFDDWALSVAAGVFACAIPFLIPLTVRR
jgi:hypothetical protein